MERPFDYPGCHSDYAYSVSRHDMKRLATGYLDLDAIEDNSDGNVTWYGLFDIPTHWTRSDLELLMDTEFAEEHCYHSYDCCGNLYPNRGTYRRLGPDRLYIEQRYLRNV